MWIGSPGGPLSGYYWITWFPEGGSVANLDWLVAMRVALMP